jgi:DNA repair exonuclease SbcCD ATPase subunit
MTTATPAASIEAATTAPNAAPQPTAKESATALEVRLLGLNSRFEQLRAQTRDLRSESTELRDKQGRAIADHDKKIAADTRTRLHEIADLISGNESALNHLESEIEQAESAHKEFQQKAKQAEYSAAFKAFEAAAADAHNSLVNWWETEGKEKQEVLMAAMSDASYAEKCAFAGQFIARRFYERGTPGASVRVLLPTISDYCAKGKIAP